MGLFENLFGGGLPRMSGEQRREAERLIDALVGVGRTDDFLSERPGGQFNAQCHNVRARAIGKRLHEIGGLPLMMAAYRKVKKRLGANMGAHLEYAWDKIGDWSA